MFRNSCNAVRTGGCPWVHVAVAGSLAAAPCVSAQEILSNPGFESGSAFPWFGIGGAQLSISTDAVEGDFSLLTSNRTQAWNSPNQNVAGSVLSGRTYQFGVSVKLLQPSSQPVVTTVRIDDANGTRFQRVASVGIPADEWTRVTGSVTLNLAEPVSSVSFYVEGPPAGVDYLIDDASLVAVDGYDWVAVANAGIDEHRKRDFVVRVTDQDGFPRDDATVSVDQLTRDFRFGSAVNAGELDNPQYTQFFLEHFNMATPENAWKWYATEGFAQGFENYNNADAFRDFCVANGIKIHGHTILWAVQQFVPNWVQALTGQALQDAVDNRVQSVVTRFDGAVDAWDVNNEMLHGNFYESRLGPGFRPALFQQVAALDPDVPLFVNDYNIFTENEIEDYIVQINDLLAAGTPISGIGVQGHYSRVVDPFELRAQFDRLGSLGIPIRITEYDNILNGTVQQKADSLEAMYRVAFSHPSVEAISLWGFWAGSHWRGAEAAIVDLDWTINPVGQRLLDLFNEWTTSESGGVDTAGEFSARAFHGTHLVSATTPDGMSDDATVSIPAGSGPVVIDLVVERLPCNVADVAGPRGTLDPIDLLTFIGLLDAGSAEADLDGDGVPTTLDLILALRAFDEGC